MNEEFQGKKQTVNIFKDVSFIVLPFSYSMIVSNH